MVHFKLSRLLARRPWATSILLAGLVPGSMPAGAQNRELPEITLSTVIPFHFGPPGARSLGMGGTFIAFADDATASEANPAGLASLHRPEVSIHFRDTSVDTETIDLNAASVLDLMNFAREEAGAEFDMDFEPLAPGGRDGNAFAGDTTASFDVSETEISFASYVKPFEDYTFSIYFQQPADFTGQNSFEAFDDSFLDFYTTRQELALSIKSVGVSAAFTVNDFVSVGFSLRYSTLEIMAFQESRVDFFADLELESFPGMERLVPGDSLADVRSLHEELGFLDVAMARETLLDEDGDITFNVGVLLNPSGKWSLGLVYKDGGDYKVTRTREVSFCVDSNGLPVPDPEEGVRVLVCNRAGRGSGALLFREEAAPSRIKVPDFYGAGLAFRPTERLKLALDVNGITYSDLDPGVKNNPAFAPAVRQAVDEVDDELELHFGAEYRLDLGSQALFVRGGYFTNPDHDGAVAIGSDESAFTLGLGTVLRERIQIDLAAQFSDSADAGILSFVYRFSS